MNISQAYESPEESSLKAETDNDSLITWYTRDEAARILGVTVRTVDRLRKRGRLVDLDSDGAVRISRDSIELYLRRPIKPIVPATMIIPVPADNYDHLVLELQHYRSEVKRLGGIEQQLEAVKSENQTLKERLKSVIADANSKFTIWSLLFGRCGK